MSRKAFSAASSLPLLKDTAREAGRLIMRHYQTGHVVERKDDKSPVTAADREADLFIVTALKSLTPDIPIVSEEGDKPDVSQAEHFWLVDPLDGTRSFIRGEGYFTVNIGLISYGVPVLGVICEPKDDILYWGSEEGAFREDAGRSVSLHAKAAAKTSQAALISHAHINPATEAYLNRHGIHERIPCPSSIKFCFLAESRAGLYPRFGPTMEWDTAAGQAILQAAGGRVLTPEGTPFTYGKPGFLNGAFIAYAN